MIFRYAPLSEGLFYRHSNRILLFYGNLLEQSDDQFAGALEISCMTTTQAQKYKKNDNNKK